jgi:hypothetical protein
VTLPKLLLYQSGSPEGGILTPKIPESQIGLQEIIAVLEPNGVASATLLEYRDYTRCFGYPRSITFAFTHTPEASVMFPAGTEVIRGI